MKAAHYLILGLAIAVKGWSGSAQTIDTQGLDFQTLGLQTMNSWQPSSYTEMRLDLKEPAKDYAVIQPLPDFSSRTSPGAYSATPSTGTGIVVSRSYTTPSRVADSKFFLLNGLHLGMAVFDVEMTQRCIASHRCHEANPLMPSSRAGQFSVNFALVGSGAWASYWLKKHKKLWWLPPSTGIVAHSLGVATGFEHQ